METTTDTARAVRVHRYGGPDAMAIETVAVPPPGPGEVRLAQRAVGINYLDTYVRRGVFPLPALPGVLGCEGAGVVEAVGEGVRGFAPGARVAYAGLPHGAYASRRVLPAAWLARLPDGIDFETAAAAMLQGMTAHMLVTRVRPLAPGDTVLVHAAAGGLGLILCQWARVRGARVLGTVGSPEKAERVRALGVEPILYKREDFAAAVDRLTGGAGVEAVYEGVGGDTLARSLPCLKPFGTAVNLGQVAGPLPAVALSDLGPQRALSVAVPGVFAHLRTLPDLQAGADALFAMVASGRIAVHVGGRWPLAEAAAAHRALESGATAGSLILTVDGTEDAA